MVDIQKIVNDANTANWPKFAAGDLIEVGFVVKNKDKSRVQIFKGRVIAKKNKGFNASATVKKTSHGVEVERVFQLNSPEVASIKVLSHGKVRRAKLYYLRQLSGRKARIAQKIVKKNTEGK
jgi:large subunit ribosomal protein L19